MDLVGMLYQISRMVHVDALLVTKGTLPSDDSSKNEGKVNPKGTKFRQAVSTPENISNIIMTLISISLFLFAP